MKHILLLFYLVINLVSAVDLSVVNVVQGLARGKYDAPFTHWDHRSVGLRAFQFDDLIELLDGSEKTKA